MLSSRCSGGCSTRYRHARGKRKAETAGKVEGCCGPTACAAAALGDRCGLASGPQRRSLRLRRRAARSSRNCGTGCPEIGPHSRSPGSVVRSTEQSASAVCSPSSGAATASTSSTSAATSPRRCRRLEDRRGPSSSSSRVTFASLGLRGWPRASDDLLELHQFRPATTPSAPRSCRLAARGRLRRLLHHQALACSLCAFADAASSGRT